jgi:16S rRNA C1402 (ribose-2'-O) methylase RsmI
MRIPVFLIASPIGDYLQDLSVSAIHTLESVTHVFVEANDKYLERLRERNIISDRHQVYLLSEPQLERAQGFIQAKEPFAILASSGIPCFLDPGSELVALCLDHHLDDVDLIPVGVSSALDAALCMCGLDVDIFHFNGHYPEHHVFESSLPDNGIPLVYFVRGGHVADFLADVRTHVSHVRRLVLLKDLRKKQRAQVTVVSWPPADDGKQPIDPPDADYVCVIDRSRDGPGR